MLGCACSVVADDAECFGHQGDQLVETRRCLELPGCPDQCLEGFGGRLAAGDGGEFRELLHVLLLAGHGDGETLLDSVVGAPFCCQVGSNEGRYELAGLDVALDELR